MLYISFLSFSLRYMVANRDIHPGDIIFHDQAAVVGPDPGSLPMCLECHALVRIYKNAIHPIVL